ncbi:MAG: glycosyltransferase family 1 protein [Chitinophagales bacterium]
MKIAIIADPLDNQSAGIHTYVKQFINALVEHDKENEYILIREKKDPSISFRQIAIPNIRLPIGFASMRLFFIIPLILSWLRVDVVLEPAHFGPFNLPKRIKRITVIHDLTPLLFPQFHRFHSQLLQRIFLKIILKKTNLILSNSQHTTQDITQFFPFTKSKISTILLGGDSEFRPVASRTYLDKNEVSQTYFLFTGTIEPRKNLTLLLEAYHQFRKRIEERVLLIITGKEGWKTTDFHQKLEKHAFRQDIILTGFVEKKSLIELYSHSLALIYPSLYEGFGLPVLEALSCQTNVICSNRSSLPEVGGDVAYYFNPESAEDLLQQMIVVYTNPQANQDKLLAQAEKFSWKKYANSFVQELSHLGK